MLNPIIRKQFKQNLIVFEHLKLKMFMDKKSFAKITVDYPPPICPYCNQEIKFPLECILKEIKLCPLEEN